MQVLDSIGESVRGILVVVIFALSSVQGECPHDANERAEQCTRQLGFGPGASGLDGFLGGGKANRAIQACGDGDLLNAINCIARLKDQCKHDSSNSAHFLRSMIDIDKARNSILFFCTNVKVYVANADCIASHHDEMDACAMVAKDNFQTQAGATSNMDVLIRFQCMFFWEAIYCAEKVVKEKCSEAAADIVKTVTAGFEPPNCASVGYGVSAGRTGLHKDTKEGNNDAHDDGFVNDGRNKAVSSVTSGLFIVVYTSVLLLLLLV